MLQQRQKTCFATCPGKEEQNEQFFGCVADCYEEDIRMVKTLDKKMSDDWFLNIDKIFD